MTGVAFYGFPTGIKHKYTVWHMSLLASVRPILEVLAQFMVPSPTVNDPAVKELFKQVVENARKAASEGEASGE